ncbi:MAG: hypothetical protein QME45_11105 [Clostridiales bacterium]|nr:hypothetical protein [Clostridiales bacterium]
MKKFFTVIFSLMLIFSNFVDVQPVFAYSKNPNTVTKPDAFQYCSVYGTRHYPDHKYLAKVLIDGDNYYSNFTRADCACGAEIFYDGYPHQGFVGQYFTHYYDTFVDTNGWFTVYRVHTSDISEHYTSGDLADWYLTAY